MRIISKFHDYYDPIQRLGQDQTVVYLREKKAIEVGWPFPSCNSYWLSYRKCLTRVCVIGFCGKITPLVKLRADEESPYFMCWNIEDTDAFMRAHLKAHQWRNYHKSKWSERTAFLEFFEACAQRESNFEYLFRDHHSPLFVAGSQESKIRTTPQIVFNACLKDVQFYTRFDSYQAFQEIAMYMGGVLGTHGGHTTKYKGEPMSSEVSDRDLAAAKGFDKFSFRKEKK